MRRHEDLQVKLRDRLRRLLTADFQSFPSAVAVVRDFIASDPLLMAILTEAAAVEPDQDLDAFFEHMAQQDLYWQHTTEEGQATASWAAMNRYADDELHRDVAVHVTGEGNYNDANRQFTEMVFGPLFDFLIERVGDRSSVLHAFERYVRLVEWFDRDELFARYEGDRAHGEHTYDAHLRRFLFAEGIDMPFTQARSPSGAADALAQVDTDDPLVCEVKLFDAGSHGKRNVAAGLHQALQYAADYGKSDAYLVVIDLSGRMVDLPTDGDSTKWPKYLDVAGVRVYLIVVRAFRLASASELGRAQPVTFSRPDLVDQDEQP